jgi:hypothetical protein
MYMEYVDSIKNATNEVENEDKKDVMKDEQ